MPIKAVAHHLYQLLIRTLLLPAVFLTPIRLVCQAPSTLGPDGPPEEYRLAPGDEVLIRFFYDPELNDDTQIRPDGNITLQLIGEVHFAERTVPDVTAELERRYASEIKSPRVTVQLRSYASQKVYVTGEVQRPGTISLIGGQDVMTAIAEAGGARQSGKTHSAILVRKGPDGKILARKLSFGQQNQLAEKLHPFDMIVVSPRAIVRVDRFVEEYIRGVVPANMEAGFQYLFTHTASAVSVVPF